MKKLFTLKSVPYRYENMMSAEAAECYYRNGLLPWGNGARRVSEGFYSRELTFAEWIDRYRIVIMGREAEDGRL